MFSLSKHISTQVGNVAGTVQSIGTGSLKAANTLTGGVVGKAMPATESAGPKPVTDPIPPRDHPTSRPARILSLDGGGVRGYSALIILQAFMLRLKVYMGSEKDILPADFFDLIIGTSTGGIMALMLGRLRMSVDDCIKSYQQLSSKIFGGGIATTFFSGGLLGTGRGLGFGMGIVKGRDIDNYFNMATSSIILGEPSMYDGTKLEKHVKRSIKTQPHTWDNEEELLEESSPDNCLTAIVTARQTNAAAPHVMRSYLRKDQPTADKVKIWEAARATSAAPAFFSPVAIGDLGVVYIDGAVSGHCNPAVLAREEAEQMWPGREICLLLSLGTGSPTEVSLSGQVSSKLIGFIGLSANTIQVHEAVARAYHQTHESGHTPYVRLSVENTIDKIRMDDYEKMPQVASATATYLAKETSVQLLTHAVELGTGYTQIIRKDPSRQGSVFRSPSLSPTYLSGTMSPGSPPQSPPFPQGSFGYPQQPYFPQQPAYSFAPTGQPMPPNPTDSPVQDKAEVASPTTM
ncbi:hypothetical protein FRC08_005311 [Ceratobasidium sp. 394]|nr:hypothetical protein FRC08_005311 [Ceratobasidium sp. 394]KAG9100582.1 hypothetical protein FS749_014335 [Ceratobasidium sp. UAMH 11750]